MKKLILLVLVLIFTGAELLSQRILLNQTFESGPYTTDSIPIRWTKFKVNGPGACTTPPISDWRVRDSGKIFCQSGTLPTHTSKAYYSNKSLCIPWTATTGTTADDWIFTDSLMLMYGDSLNFWVQLGSWRNGQFIDSLQVWVTSVKSPSGGTRIKLATIVSGTPGNNIWQFKAYSLNAFSYQKVYIGFRYYMNVSVDGVMVNLDNVFVGNRGSAVHISGEQQGIPDGYELKQNYPNPFNPATYIEFSLPQREFVTLVIYTPLGEEVSVPVNNVLDAGHHKINFDASELAGGIYFYKLTAGKFSMTRKMSLIK